MSLIISWQQTASSKFLFANGSSYTENVGKLHTGSAVQDSFALRTVTSQTTDQPTNSTHSTRKISMDDFLVTIRDNLMRLYGQREVVTGSLQIRYEF